MSTAIIKFEDNSNLMYYCKDHSYPAGLGFDLIKVRDDGKKFISYLTSNSDRFEQVCDIPLDIQYEYIIQKDGNVHCQESWYAKDKAYHGGGIRHGGTYDLDEWREKIRLQNLYTYRNPEYWK